MLSLHTCLLNQNDVFCIGQRVRPMFFNTGQPIGSGDMCPQIKSIYFLVLLPKNRSKSHKNQLKMSWFCMVWFGMARLWSKLVWSEKINHSCLLKWVSKYLPNFWKSDFQIGYFGQIEKKCGYCHDPGSLTKLCFFSLIEVLHLKRASRRASRQADKKASKQHLEGIQSEPCPVGACFTFIHSNNKKHI